MIRRGGRSLDEMLAWEPEPCRSDPEVVEVLESDLSVDRGKGFDQEVFVGWDCVDYIRGNNGLPLVIWLARTKGKR